jgi:hypothetical protein
MLSNFTTSNFFRYCQKRAKRIDAAILWNIGDAYE